MTYKAHPKDFKDVEKIMIGHVGVDTGGLVLVDPMYLEGEFSRPVYITGIDFWGAGGEATAELMKQNGYTVTELSDRVYQIGIQDNKIESQEQYDQAKTDLDNAIGQTGLTVVKSEHTTSFRDRCYDARRSVDEMAGVLPFGTGIPGLAVSFDSGLGDGSYEVWATYATLPNWGRRIVSVEVKFVEQDESEEATEEEVQ